MGRGGFWNLFGGKSAESGPEDDALEAPEFRAAGGRATTNDHTTLAERALAAGDLGHAFEHLSQAVVDVPDRPDLLDLIKRLTQAAGEQPERFLPGLDQPQFYGDVALCAWWRFRKGKVNDALTLLLQVAEANPDGEFLEGWALPWLEKPQALERASADLAAAVLLRLSFRYPEYRLGTPASGAIMRRAAKIAESRERHVNHSQLDVAYEPAVIALAWVAKETKAARKPVARLFRCLFRRMPQEGNVDWLHALLWHWARLPEISEAERERAFALLRECEANA